VPSGAALLDACVLYPAALRDTLLRAAAADLFWLHWSDEILEEMRRNLVENEAVSGERADQLVAAMTRAFPGARITSYKRLISRMSNHEKDRHVLAAAVAARARVIVTSNVRHFPPEALTPYGIEAQSPDEFLLALLEAAGPTMLRLLREQAAALRNPPMTVEEVLADISLQAPRFARAMRRTLADAT
jgi:predicted nucleic acid-binding protein